LWLTPREEEPQIVVPLADVVVDAPGLPVEEVERQVSTRLEKLLAQIDGVEHVYSMSLPDRAVVTVRFYVGEDRENSLVKIYNKIESNRDVVPPAVTSWVVKPLEIHDVPILIATLWSSKPGQIDDYALRRIGEEIEIGLPSVPQTNRTAVIGGRPRVARVELRAAALAARQSSPLDIAWALDVSNVRGRAGAFDRLDRSVLVDSGEYVQGIDGLGSLVVNVVGTDGRVERRLVTTGARDGSGRVEVPSGLSAGDTVRLPAGAGSWIGSLGLPYCLQRPEQASPIPSAGVEGGSSCAPRLAGSCSQQLPSHSAWLAEVPSQRILRRPRPRLRRPPACAASTS